MAGAASEGNAADHAYRRAIRCVASLIVAAVAAALGLLFAISSSLSRRLGGEPRDAAAVASAIARGNLAVAVPLKPGDDSSLMFSLDTVKRQLTAIVCSVRQSGESISIAASQIAQRSSELSRRSEKQASSLEEAASVEELTSIVRRNADHAREANRVAIAASEVAKRGGQEIGRVAFTMHEIADRFAKVVDIIGVIERIASQANVLALNAAVEAARAGGQGSGFAVVAGEVRTLAQRSATAAKEIKVLVTESVEHIGAGSRQVESAGHTVAEIVNSAGRTMDIMGEIAAASEEQRGGIGYVDWAIIQMDQMTQQNAALAEHASAAARSLAQQARYLLDVVAVIQADEGAARRRSPVHEAIPCARDDLNSGLPTSHGTAARLPGHDASSGFASNC